MSYRRCRTIGGVLPCCGSAVAAIAEIEAIATAEVATGHHFFWYHDAPPLLLRIAAWYYWALVLHCSGLKRSWY